jgi:Flp pilus assembly protein TadG
MLIRKQRKRSRWGVTAVETALVLIPLLMLFVGIFEYSRLMMAWNLLNNSAREGCRYALVNNTSATISSDVQTLVTKYMAGQNACFTNFTVSVSGTHQGVTTSVNNLVAGDMIIVTVSGQYVPMNAIPGVHLPTNLTLSSAVTMVCEGVM